MPMRTIPCRFFPGWRNWLCRNVQRELEAVVDKMRIGARAGKACDFVTQVPSKARHYERLTRLVRSNSGFNAPPCNSAASAQPPRKVQRFLVRGQVKNAIESPS
jgi:hypothetical protein